MEMYNVHRYMKRNHLKGVAILLTAVLLLNTQSCLEITHTYSMVAPGMWRGLLDLRDQATLPPHPEHTDPSTKFDFSETPEGVLPFNFEVTYPEPDSMQFFLINGEEREAISSYKYEPNVRGETGALTLYFPVYDTHIEARVEAGVMEGTWYVDYKSNYSIPFKAYLGQKFRFTDVVERPVADITGRWGLTFSPGSPEEYPAIGEFTLEGSSLQGNFATETGDYRYASGNVTGDDIYLSTFDGLLAYLYEGKIISPDSILGAFYSGNHYRTTWEGRRNSDAALRPAESITSTTTDKPVRWQSESITGDVIDFDLPPYQGKIKILEIMGSWCPNCHDEARFLKEWKAKNPDLPVQIVSLAYERYEDQVKSLRIIKEFQNRMGIDWPVVYGGTIQSANDSELINFIDELRAFPTLIVFDPSNKIRYVHTGFSGPATAEYDGFVKEFTDLVKKLNEKG